VQSTLPNAIFLRIVARKVKEGRVLDSINKTPVPSAVDAHPRSGLPVTSGHEGTLHGDRPRPRGGNGGGAFWSSYRTGTGLPAASPDTAAS